MLVAGHPGRTERLLTSAALQYRREVRLPFLLEMASGGERALLGYAAAGAEQARRAADSLFGTQNWLKVLRGQTRGLNDTPIIRDKKAWEHQTQAVIAVRQDLKAYADIWERVTDAQEILTELHPRLMFLEDGYAFWSDVFGFARTLVRLAAEDAKADAQRLREFNDSRRAELEVELFSEHPIYSDLEIAKLTSSLAFMQRKLGKDDPIVREILAGKSPAERAAELMNGTKLRDVAERRRLKSGGQAAIDASDDAMIRLAVLVDPESRRLRAVRDAKVDEPLLRAYADLSRLIFELQGPDSYPDATYTLRLAAGTVRGYEQDGQTLRPWTTIGGAFDNEAAHGGAAPWKLPAKWHAARPRLATDTPLDFVSTADIVGGNSGSPTLNRSGEIVGLIFDGNRHSLSDSYGYSEQQRRAIHVDARAIRELMGRVYGADALLREMGIADSL